MNEGVNHHLCYPRSERKNNITTSTLINWTLIYLFIVFGCVGSFLGFPGDAVVKNLPANAGDTRDVGSITSVKKIPWRRTE